MDQEDPLVPVITLTRERFSRFVGVELTLTEMIKWLPWLGFDMEETWEDSVKVEFNPNRIDFSSYAGIARAFRGLRGYETGLPEYDLKDSRVVLNINESVSRVRPFMLAAIVRGISLDEDAVVDLMEMQEDLHWGIGRNREKASIGVHNLDVVRPPFTFKAVEPHSIRFVPLDMTKEMSPNDVLRKHEKGIAYRHLVEQSPRYPLLVDRDNEILSMPPIINGELTRIAPDTKNLFLDVTGTEYIAVEKCLNVLSTALADMGGSIEKVRVEYPDRTVLSPDLSPQKMKLRTLAANKLLGLKLSDTKIAECLEKCRLGTKRLRKGIFEVAIPAYRTDILHEVDLIEEVAIGYGYYKLKPHLPSSATIGKQHPAYKIANTGRLIMTGLSFTEVVNFTITNEILHYEKMCRKAEVTVKLANPISTEFTIMRHDLLPGLMKNLAENKHESFPQRFFEISDVIWHNPKLETRCERRMHIAAVSSHPSANFTKIKSGVEAFAANMRLKSCRFEPTEHPTFIPGRAATISAERKNVGIVGEIHPEVLNNFELENPVAAFEIDLETLIR